MKLFAVVEDSGHEGMVIGIFDTREKAQVYVDKYASHRWIEGYELNELLSKYDYDMR